jgi:hypothetical protein
MKTPMQFLKDEIESKVFPPTYNDGNLTDYQYGHNIAYSVVLTLIEYLLEVEKELILDAHINGQSEFDMLQFRDINKTLSDNYFNQKYNQKQHIIDIMKADEDDGLYNQNK